MWAIIRFRFLELLPFAQDTIIDGMRDGVAILNTSGQVVYLNKVICGILGRSASELIGKSATYEFAQTEDPENPIFAAHQRALQGIASRYEAEIGGAIYQSYLEPLLDASGEVIGTIGIASEITSQRQSERALRRQLAELTVLNAVATTCAEASDEDALIERVTQIISQSIFTDNFGILLSDQSSQILRIHPSYLGIPEGVKTAEIAMGQGITGQTAADGVARRVSDVTKESGYKLIHPLTRSELCVPIQITGRVLGVINAESIHIDAFTDADERLLNTLAGQLATAIERVRVEAAEKQRVQELLAITAVSHEIASSLDHQVVLDSIVRHAAEISNSDASGLFELQPDGRLYLVAVYGVGERFVEALNEHGVGLVDSVVGHALQARSPYQVVDLLSDTTVSTQELGAIEHIRLVLALPMLRGDNVIGGVVVWRRQPRRFTPEEETYLQALTNQSVNAIENARLFEETQRRLSEVTLLSKVIALTTTATDMTSALTQICAEIANFYQTNQVVFLALDLLNSQATIVAQFPRPDQLSAVGVSVPFDPRHPIAARLLNDKTPLVITDAQTDPLLAPVQEFLRQFEVASTIVIPLLEGGQVTALLGISTQVRYEFSEADVAMMRNIASQVGQALERLSLFTATRQRAMRMVDFATLSSELNWPLTEDEVINGIGVNAQVLGRSDRVAIYLRISQDTAYCPWYRGLSPDYVAQVTEFLQSVPGGQLLHRTDPVLVPDASRLPPDNLLRKLAAQEAYHAVNLWPLVYEETVVAAVGLYYDTPHEVDQVEKEILMAFTRQAAVALQNARLFEETRRRAVQQEAINQIIAAAVAAPDLANLLETVLDLTLQAVQADKGGLWVSGYRVLRDLPDEIRASSFQFAQDIEAAPPTTLVVDDWQQVTEGDSLETWREYVSRDQVQASLLVPV